MQINLISIVVPCYNASAFILDTIQSILKQVNVDFELIIINDGSSDNSEQIIKSIEDDRIQYYYQVNKGVSAARNFGLTLAKGNYVVFFDSDDLMIDNFLSSRFTYFTKNVKVDFVGGTVTKFNTEGLINGYYRGPDNENIHAQILLYDSSIITCPSNFMFRHDFLIKNKLKFNEKLSSTADRYFLLECSTVGAGSFNADLQSLYYRVNEASMSNKLTKSLVRDNELFYEELKANNLVPEKLRKVSFFCGYYILCGANYKIDNYYMAVKFGFIAFIINPIGFMVKIFGK